MSASAPRSGSSRGWLDRLSVLSDLGRVRLLRLLQQRELGVGELARSLQWPQSTVSRQLKPLHESGWVHRRVEGTTAFYRLAEEVLDDATRGLWQTSLAQLGEEPTFPEDDRRLAEVVAARRTDSRSFFGRIGGEWDELRRELFGIHFIDEALVGLLPPTWAVADLGCGAGEIAARLAPLVRRVIAVDRETSMIAAARTRLDPFANAEVREGDLLDLPIEDGEVDAAILALVLHHVEAPQQAVREATRILAPGGVLLVLDMAAHGHEALAAAMGHLHLGFDEATVHSWAAPRSGLRPPLIRRLRPDPHGRGPGLFAATFVRG
jgi:SAM-dependent methyltransferase